MVSTGAYECSVETARGLRLVLPVALPIGERVCLALRAHDVLLSADPPGRVSARNVLPARVERIEIAGGDASVTLDAGEPLVAKLTTGAVERLALRPGSQVLRPDQGPDAPPDRLTALSSGVRQASCRVSKSGPLTLVGTNQRFKRRKCFSSA